MASGRPDAIVRVTLNAYGSSYGSATLTPFETLAEDANFFTDRRDLTTGDNTITLPDGVTGFVLQPPADNAVAILDKGSSTTDTGRRIHDTHPYGPINLHSSVTQIVLSVGSAVSVTIFWY